MTLESLSGKQHKLNFFSSVFGCLYTYVKIFAFTVTKIFSPFFYWFDLRIRGKESKIIVYFFSFSVAENVMLKVTSNSLRNRVIKF